MDDENCAQFCLAGLLRSPALRSVPGPAGWRAPLPARARSASPAATLAGCVGVCAGEERAPRGQRGRGGEPAAPPAPRELRSDWPDRLAGAGWGLPESGDWRACSPTLTPHVRDAGRDSNSCLLCSPRGSAFFDFLRQTPSDPECPSTAWEGEEGKSGDCGSKSRGGGDLIICVPTQLPPRTSSWFQDFPSGHWPTALFPL